MHSILTMPQSSITSLTETNTSSESTLYKQQLFLRLTLYKDYLRRLRIDVDSNEIKASDLNSDILIRINDSFLLGNSSERIAGEYLYMSIFFSITNTNLYTYHIYIDLLNYTYLFPIFLISSIRQYRALAVV